MSRPIIEIKNLSKVYQLGSIGATSLRDEVERLWNRMCNRHEAQKKGAFWALRDVSFDVMPGEVLGIIGRNGAGKSTLLKILSRITQQTAGEIVMRGRVASLLEVGTGFHPDLTGRENIFLNGAILGMRRAEIRRKLDEIIAFAEVEQFIDTPVKRYSSGMYVRLAFAVAAHLEPEILIIDEVLAVGDSQFQKKCLGKMGDASREGRTVIFVSHNMVALQSLCQRAVWLNGGQLMGDGKADEVVTRYLEANDTLLARQMWSGSEIAPDRDEIHLRKVSVFPDGGNPSDAISVRTAVRLEFEFWNPFPNEALNLSMVLYTLDEVCVLNTTSPSKKEPAGLIRGTCLIPANFLNDGSYRVRILIVKEASQALLDLPCVALFEVHDIERTGNWFGKWVGVVRPQFDWVVETMESVTPPAPPPATF